MRRRRGSIDRRWVHRLASDTHADLLNAPVELALRMRHHPCRADPVAMPAAACSRKTNQFYRAPRLAPMKS